MTPPPLLPIRASHRGTPADAPDSSFSDLFARFSIFAEPPCRRHATIAAARQSPASRRRCQSCPCRRLPSAHERRHAIDAITPCHPAPLLSRLIFMREAMRAGARHAAQRATRYWRRALLAFYATARCASDVSYYFSFSLLPAVYGAFIFAALSRHEGSVLFQARVW
jgi:hypothetical protein